MKPLVILVLILFFTPVKADALLDAIFGRYPSYEEVTTEKNNTVYDFTNTYEEGVDLEYGNDSEYYTEEGYGEVFEFEDYHLCQYCNTEIIIMDYGSTQVEDEY